MSEKLYRFLLLWGKSPRGMPGAGWGSLIFLVIALEAGVYLQLMFRSGLELEGISGSAHGCLVRGQLQMHL